MKDYTENLLKAISERLSGRDDCKKIEYMAMVMPVKQNDAVYYTICFYPDIMVYPDRYHKKKTDLLPIVQYVAHKHFSDILYKQEGALGPTCFVENSLVTGTYKYKLSADGKRRRWIKDDPESL